MKGVPHLRPNPPPLGKKLSEKERLVLKYLGQGWQATDLARELCVAKQTIDTYRTRILDKLGIDSEAELAVYCYVHHVTDWPFERPGYSRRRVRDPRERRAA